MRIGLLSAIGNTPLVRVPTTSPYHLYAKMEYMNPGGSTKDRTALFMIEHAEREGLLHSGGTILEASSGNQGIALAMIGAVKGYSVIITTAETTSTEKIETMRAYGAKVILCPPTPSANDPRNYRSIARTMHQEMPESFMPDQFHNLLNPLSHYAWLGPEIWSQTKGKVTHVFSAVGSGGTVSGVGRFLKERNPAIIMHAVDAEGSFYATKGKPLPYTLDGMGLDEEWPTLDTSVIDDMITISDKDGFSMMRSLARQYGILVGPSSGAVMSAVDQRRDSFTKDDMVIMIFGDSGRAYMSKGYFSSQHS